MPEKQPRRHESYMRKPLSGLRLSLGVEGSNFNFGGAKICEHLPAWCRLYLEY
jgi:hypothetical protein